LGLGFVRGGGHNFLKGFRGEISNLKKKLQKREGWSPPLAKRPSWGRGKVEYPESQAQVWRRRAKANFEKRREPRAGSEPGKDLGRKSSQKTENRE